MHGRHVLAIGTSVCLVLGCALWLWNRRSAEPTRQDRPISRLGGADLAEAPRSVHGRAGLGLARAVPESLPPVRAQVDRALAAAARYLADRQSRDGAWRSEVYAPFQDGGALTPLVLEALLGTEGWLEPADAELVDTARRRGTAYLVRIAPSAGRAAPPEGGTYPVYTAAGAISALCRVETAEARAARDSWRDFLRARQLAEDLGWRPADPEYGGWSYATGLPRKPETDDPMSPLEEPNLSATLFAVEALRAAGAGADDPALRKALAFVQRCQNACDNSERHEPEFDDGGFFFMLDDPIRNKAGPAGSDRSGRLRFQSYGSTTADGLRALLACGVAADAPRAAAARRWLVDRFQADAHPGDYVAEREVARPGLYYYYTASVARAFRAAGVVHVSTAAGAVPWAEALAEELIRRQRPDGSWSNPAVNVREDDPLVATSLAVAALGVCRSVWETP